LELRKRNIPMVWTSRPVSRLKGIIRAPGDKSCSHRALIMGGIADGTSHFTGLLEGDDVLRTGAAMAALGAVVTRTGAGEWTVAGTGPRGLASPAAPLDFGNSGTGSRLMMGLMAGYDLTAELCGDTSLSARPMNRILDPLRSMGMTDTAEPHGRLPFRLTGSSALKAITYAPPQASAQVKSAVLLAGLNAHGTTRVEEAKSTRDHTERMLRGFGAEVGVTRGDGQARTISLPGGQKLSAIEAAIPGDPSSAAFLIAAGLISPDGDVMVEGVMSNPTRSGFFDLAELMGARLGAEDTGEAAGERLIDIQSGSAALIGRHVPPRLVPSMIDEFPILAVLAAFATGETVVTGAEELRVKETDRVKAVVDMLRANGIEAEEREDGFVVQGCGGPPPGGGLVETRHDHRIAMSALILGTAAQKPVSVDDISMIATSYPDFLSHMATLGADISAG
jgi:3-phosphoshikimate 1-carboxyvinyltransferase